MHVDLHMSWPCFVKRGHNPSAKRFGPCQPALSTKADLARNILHLVKFLHLKGTEGLLLTVV